MKQNNKEIFLKFDLHGFDRDDIKIRLSKNSINIKAIKSNKTKKQRENFFHVEKLNNRFDYNSSLPKIDPKKAKIEFKKGELKIRAPKV